MLPVKKIYVDTKYKTNDSVSNSHFKIQLPETLLMPDNCVFYIDDVCIPHSWYTIEAGINDKLYFHVTETDYATDVTTNYLYAVALDSKMYTKLLILYTFLNKMIVALLLADRFENHDIRNQP